MVTGVHLELQSCPWRSVFQNPNYLTDFDYTDPLAGSYLECTSY